MKPGALVLVPNALDLGAPPQPLAGVLSAGVLQRAATITYWLVEDARSARAFLARVQATHPLAAPVQQQQIVALPRPPRGHAPPVPPARWHALLAPASAGHDMGLLSEAGLPAVADPGSAVVAAAHELGLEVQVLPGPSALVMALAASGLQGQNFAFVGYLPQEAGARALRIRELEARSRLERQAQIFIETPYRNAALMQALLVTLAPQTRLSISVGLTLPQGYSRMASVGHWRRQPPAWPERVPAVFVLQG
jgi:16S rRNA (cytidine1402-2'-O)-methyltransferase